MRFFEDVRPAERAVVAAAVAFGIIGIGWGLPCSDAWAADAISPRACGLGAIVESYWPGHFHQYPPLHLLLLTILSLPWILLGVLRARASGGALESTLIEPATMTPIELATRLLAVAMFAGIALTTVRLWERLLRASGFEGKGQKAVRLGALAAGAVVALNPILVYYAHTGNLEIPYLFWSLWGLLEFDRVLAGEARERPALLAMTAAVLTKDQAAGIFVLTVPIMLLVFPEVARRRRFWWACLQASGGYLVVSGALVNPRGFARRCAVLFGPASADWAQYPRGWGGRLALARDAVLATPRYGSWGLGLAAIAGVGVALSRSLSPENGDRSRARALLPLVSALSFTALFTFGARRTEDRFLLPQSLLLMPYASALVPLAVAWARSRWGRVLVVATVTGAGLPALITVASMLGTLLVDSRYEAEAWLRQLPPGTQVEVYGGPHFLPRLPTHLALARVGLDDPEARSHLPGLAEVHASPNAIDERRPAYVVLSTEFSQDVGDDGAVKPIYGVASYADADSNRFFANLTRGALPYERVVRAVCSLPWPLSCRSVHGSTAGNIWIYRRRE